MTRRMEAVIQNNHRWQLGDKVRKKRGSSWRGTVCGFYSTPHTPNGYSVVSLYEPVRSRPGRKQRLKTGMA